MQFGQYLADLLVLNSKGWTCYCVNFHKGRSCYCVIAILNNIYLKVGFESMHRPSVFTLCENIVNFQYFNAMFNSQYSRYYIVFYNFELNCII